MFLEQAQDVAANNTLIISISAIVVILAVSLFRMEITGFLMLFTVIVSLVSICYITDVEFKDSKIIVNQCVDLFNVNKTEMLIPIYGAVSERDLMAIYGIALNTHHFIIKSITKESNKTYLFKWDLDQPYLKDDLPTVSIPRLSTILNDESASSLLIENEDTPVVTQVNVN